MLLETFCFVLYRDEDCMKNYTGASLLEVVVWDTHNPIISDNGLPLLTENTFQTLPFLICFAREIKDFYQSSLGNKVDFRDIRNVSPNILPKN